MITLDIIENKLQEFREEWETASIGRRETILLQVRALKIAKEKLEKKIHPLFNNG